jgi:hypothetical protein
MITNFSNTCKRLRLPAPSAARRAFPAAACLVLSLGLAACATTVNFSSWVLGYNISVEQAQNQLTLLNIMRASEDMPLLFTGVQVVRGNGQTTAGANIGITASSQVTSVPGTNSADTSVKALAPGASLQVSSGFNFDVVVLDSSEFYQGLLTPIGIDAMHSYMKKGVPAELILLLLVERITLTVGGVPTTYVNNPVDPDYNRFRSTLANLLKLGLTTEVESSNLPVGPLLTDADVKNDLKSLFAAAQAGLLLFPEKGGYRFMKRNTAARLCFMGGGNDVPELPQNSLCTASPKKRTALKTPAEPQRPANEVQSLADAEMSVQTRSTRDLFSYLGRLAHGQTDAGRDSVTLELPEALELPDAAAYHNISKGHSLFRVVKDRPRPDDLASIEYRGSVYSLPNEGYSATVLMVLQQLFSLSKSVNSVPATGSVVVR